MLGPSQKLPSIRTFARQLSVGDGVVRRAYRELCEAGILATERRKHIVVSPAVNAGPGTSSLVQECETQSRQVIAWAHEKQTSSIAFGRYLLARAFAEETRSPSYAFVDVNRSTAERCADKIARTWDIRVAGVSVGELVAFCRNAAHNMPAVLVNECLSEDVIELTGGVLRRVFPVAIRVDQRLPRRLGAFPEQSSLRCVFADEQFPRAKAAILQKFKAIFGKKFRCHSRIIGEIPDLPALIQAGHYRLVLVGPLVWDRLPARIKRTPGVVQMAWEPDPYALEAIRVPAGILL